MSENNLHIDNDLFQRIAEGDKAAFTTIFNNCYPLLHTIAFRYLKSEFWADEIVQEIFTDIWRSRQKLANIENPGGWLHRLVWNKSIDHIRRSEAEVKAQYTFKVATMNDGNSEWLENKERIHELLEEGVALLPPQRKLIYQLRYQDKLSLVDIAKRLQLSRNTVRNHLSLIVNDLRNFLLANTDFYLILIALLSFF